jgi:hypothetical protein
MIKEGIMKKLLLVSLLFVMVLGSSIVFAAEKAPIGAGNLALKVDYINFTDGDMDDLDTDSGLYVGLEAYSHLADIAPNFYIGVEVGYAKPDGSFEDLGDHYDTEATFVPIELNLKYAMSVAPNFVIDFGAGGSLNYASVEITETEEGEAEVKDDDWLWGGQIFADLNYKINQFFIGINAKYQITENFDRGNRETDLSFRNWRIGGQAGIMF